MSIFTLQSDAPSEDGVWDVNIFGVSCELKQSAEKKSSAGGDYSLSTTSPISINTSSILSSLNGTGLPGPANNALQLVDSVQLTKCTYSTDKKYSVSVAISLHDSAAIADVPSDIASLISINSLSVSFSGET